MADIMEQQHPAEPGMLDDKLERTHSEMSIGGATSAIQLPVDKPHLLRHAWTLWYDTPISSNRRSSHSTWASNLKKVVTVRSVEDFWGVYKSIPKARELMGGANYYFFKDGTKPMWEDPANATGGKWTIPAPKSDKEQLLDDFWLHTMMACIGNECAVAGDISGVVLAIRPRQNRIAIWTKSVAEASVVAIGSFFKGYLDVSTDARIGFQPHFEDSKSTSYGSKDKFSL